MFAIWWHDGLVMKILDEHYPGGLAVMAA